MPVTADLFPELFTPFTTTAVFTEATIEAVEKTLTEKKGKPYLKCLVRGKDVMAKPEEIVHQLWLVTHHTKYKATINTGGESSLAVFPFRCYQGSITHTLSTFS
jgi:hypothetical protein